MPVLRVTIKALAPLVFSERRPGGQFRPSELYVPGAVIRGALAQRLLDAGLKDSEDFRALFHGEAILFRNAYPAAFYTPDPEAAPLASRPLPATAYACKTKGGFKKPRDADAHGVFDGLIDRLCCEALGAVVPYVPRCNHRDHAGKGERVEARSGFYAMTPAGAPHDAKVSLHLTTRVAVNRSRRVAEERMLHSPLVISETIKVKDSKDADSVFDTTFYGSVVADGSGLEAVRKHLGELRHVGSGAARGFGRVAVEADAVAEDDPATRVERFNDRLRERWALWEKLRPRGASAPAHSPGEGTFFSVMLVSDAVLREEGWSPTVRLGPEMLGAAGRNATLLRCYALADYRGGWNTAWRLPKDTELVARMGSVYVFHTSDRVDDVGWHDALKSLEQNGVGGRRTQGFGQVRVCDEFHAVIQEEQ